MIDSLPTNPPVKWFEEGILARQFTLPAVDGVGLSDSAASSAAEIFSDGSYIAIPGVDGELLKASQEKTATQHWGNSLIITAVLFFYIFFIYTFSRHYGHLFAGAISAVKSLHKYEAENRERVKLFVLNNLLIFVFYTFICYNILDYFDLFEPLDTLAISGGAVICVATFQLIAEVVIDIFGSRERRSLSLWRLRNIHTTTAVMVAMPVALTLSIDKTSLWLFVGLFVSVWLYRATRFLSLFLRRGFGVFSWILYLCAVEIMPISYLVAISMRYSV